MAEPLWGGVEGGEGRGRRPGWGAAVGRHLRALSVFAVRGGAWSSLESCGGSCTWKGPGVWAEVTQSARLVAWIRVQGGGGKWSGLGCVQSITNRKKVQGGKEEPRRPPLPGTCSLMPLPQVRAERSEDLLLGVAEAVSCQEEVWAGSRAAGADQGQVSE